jgi:hypothetical protein
MHYGFLEGVAGGIEPAVPAPAGPDGFVCSELGAGSVSLERSGLLAVELAG